MGEKTKDKMDFQVTISILQTTQYPNFLTVIISVLLRF
jgi:hypothetical protein